jgi:GTP:adenosylcobinamide-phosphate guanylyltransferase
MSRPGRLDGPYPVILMAAGRGPDDPMAKHYGVTHKCLVEVAGKPMLARVVETLLSCPAIREIGVCIENEDVLKQGLGRLADKVRFLPSAESAAASGLKAIKEMGCNRTFVITTADHVLLSHQMINDMLDDSLGKAASLSVGLARDDVILAAYPDAKRTFFKFGKDRVSGCNLFVCNGRRGVKVLEFWRHIEKNRKNPFKLVLAFGPRAVLTYLSGRMSLLKAFEIASARIGVKIVPVLIDDANAAVDVDKPVDKELVEQILAGK